MVEISSNPYLTSDFCLSSMFQNPYRFNIYIFMFTNEIRPYKSHADHRDKSCDAVHITHMGILDVEAGRFHGSKGRFYLPSFLYVKNRLLGPIEAYENLQFRNTIGVFDPAAGKIDILTFVKKERMEEFLLTDLQIIEQFHQARILSPVEGLTIQKF